MLNSAEGVTLPSACAPPMMTSSGTRRAKSGSSASAAARLDSGATATSVTGSVAARNVSIRNSTAPVSDARRVLGGTGRVVP